jgi:hypothetical protein
MTWFEAMVSKTLPIKDMVWYIGKPVITKKKDMLWYIGKPVITKKGHGRIHW